MGSLKNKQGWITVACAFVLQGLTHGLGSSMGVFYVAWSNAFPSSSTLISALATSVLATILCTAPVAGAISRKAGIRLAMAIGGAMSFGGFCLTSFVKTPSLLFLTVSVMIGVGSSIVYMSSVIAVSNHFKKNFTTASGIANAGASTGVLVLPLLFEVLVSAYDWRGACLVVAAIQLHVFVMMMIIKAPKEKTNIVITNTAASSPSGADKSKSTNKNPKDADPNSLELKQNGEVTVDLNSLELKENASNSLESEGNVQPTLDCYSLDLKEKDEVNAKTGSEGNKKMRDIFEQEGNENNGIVEVEARTGVAVDGMEPVHHDPPEPDRSLEPTDITLETVNSCNETEKSCIQLSYKNLLGFSYSLVNLFNVPLIWRNPPFSTMLISVFLGGWFLGTILPHLPSRAGDVGINKLLASSLISIYGSGNLVSRLFYGRLVDSGFVHPLILFFLAYCLTTVSTAALAFGETVPLLILGAFGIGVGSGIYIPLMQPIVRCLTGPEKFGGAFGLCLLAVGVGNFLSAICAGRILDVSNNYTYVFLLPTGVGVVCCVTILLNHLFWGVYRKHPDWPKRMVPQQLGDKDTTDLTEDEV
ncbi:Monocarboxylate transporter 9 [Holothuria leucospilota]|uniref:Monocarboxylate transporter 9 n=1 Tax=Holothuria leucospilota TaxID=206669 RepID=A0A9Q1CKD8_HOLLE|nr:Monocarboxylate transporter 9 [Holothuria leucospilota]